MPTSELDSVTQQPGRCEHPSESESSCHPTAPGMGQRHCGVEDLASICEMTRQHAIGQGVASSPSSPPRANPPLLDEPNASGASSYSNSDIDWRRVLRASPAASTSSEQEWSRAEHGWPTLGVSNRPDSWPNDCPCVSPVHSML
jgi:hypothetical protein